MTGLAADPPLVAILRGVDPREVVPIAEAVLAAGFRMVEVPMNSPRPLDSIRLLADALGDRCLVGAGTVLSPSEVEAVHAVGARLVVSPNFDPEVVAATRRLGMASLPGVLTPTEAFAARAAGADACKLFPADVLGVDGIRALKAVLPADARLFAVGGIDADNLAAFAAAGCEGFGFGSSLYRPGRSPETVGHAAEKICAAWRAVAANGA